MSSSPSPPKIIIIGAGIGGCATYLFLRKYLGRSVLVHVYDSHAHPSKGVGGGLGLAPNGINTLRALSPALADKILSSGIETEYFGVETSRGGTLGEMLIASKTRHGAGCLLIMRAAIHETLLAELPSEDVTYEKKVTEVMDADDEVVVRFADGSSEKAELVIGADGVWGKTKDAIPECRDIKPVYDGLTGIGAMLPDQQVRDIFQENRGMKLPHHSMSMAFGSAGFFGTIIDKTRLSQDSKPKSSQEREQEMNKIDADIPMAGWWATFPLEPPPPPGSKFAKYKGLLREKHEDWAPVYRTLIEKSDKDGSNRGCYVLPVWITPTLPKWSSDSGRVILMGDAAHTMPPDSGQGVSVALEDAMTLGLLFNKAFTEESSLYGSETLKKIASQYTELRKPRAEFIVAEAKKRGDQKRKLSPAMQLVRNAMIWGFCNIAPYIMPGMADSFNSYLVLPQVKNLFAGRKVEFKGKGVVDLGANEIGESKRWWEIS